MSKITTLHARQTYTFLYIFNLIRCHRTTAKWNFSKTWRFSEDVVTATNFLFAIKTLMCPLQIQPQGNVPTFSQLSWLKWPKKKKKKKLTNKQTKKVEVLLQCRHSNLDTWKRIKNQRTRKNNELSVLVVQKLDHGAIHWINHFLVSRILIHRFTWSWLLKRWIALSTG